MGAYSAAILGTSGLISYWRLDETSGTTAVDSGPNATNLTHVNSPSVGQSGPLVNSDGYSVKQSATGLTTTRVESGVSGYDGLSALTIEGWLKFVSGTSYLYSLRTPDNGVRANSNGSTEFFLTLGGTLKHLIATVSGVADGSWHHIVATWNGSTQIIYKNGSNIKSQAASGTMSTISSLFIGSNVPSSGGAEYSNGYAAEIAYYNRALTAAEITYHYNLGKGTIANREQPRPRVKSQAANRAVVF